MVHPNSCNALFRFHHGSTCILLVMVLRNNDIYPYQATKKINHEAKKEK